MAAIRRYFQGGTTKKNTESHWRPILAKRRSCFSIASLLKDTTIQLRELSVCRTPNIGFFICMLCGPKSLFDTLTWRKRNNLRDRYVRRKLRLLCRSENWMAVLQRARGNPPAASSSSSSTLHYPTSQKQTSWSSWYSTSFEKW